VGVKQRNDEDDGATEEEEEGNAKGKDSLHSSFAFIVVVDRGLPTTD
jgi:hypothetical protein